MTPDPLPAKRRIFLVDDHPLVCEGLTIMINRQSDLEVCGEAGSAPEALQAIEELRPDAALVDLTLASGSGLELIKDLRACCPDTVLVVLSMHDEATYAERALRAGARGYVMKREVTKKVITALRQVLDGKLFVSDEFARSMTEKMVEVQVVRSGSVVATLSDRELQVFEMLGAGMDSRDIADSLHIALKTVQTHCARMKVKLGVSSLSVLMREAVRWVESGRPT
ncbi:MAG: response regulator transcription factor [Verrucomicrobiota bacterium]